MKKLIIIFSLFIFLSFIFPQQYSNEKYERYVGWANGKYPPTQQGIQDAVNSLKVLSQMAILVLFICTRCI